MQEQIVKLLKNQDSTAVAQLYDTYGGVLFGIVMRIVSTKELAQQVIQDTFVKAWRNGSHYDESKGRLFTWLLNIARNTAIDITRTSHFRNSQNTTSLDVLIQSSGGNAINPDTVGLREVVQQMDEKYTTLIDLIYFQNYTYQEVADETGMPLGTVKTRVRNAIFELRKTFEYQEVQ